MNQMSRSHANVRAGVAARRWTRTDVPAARTSITRYPARCTISSPIGLWADAISLPRLPMMIDNLLRHITEGSHVLAIGDNGQAQLEIAHMTQLKSLTGLRFL